MSHNDKRQSPRRMVNLKVQHKDPKTGKSAADYARDLSRHGLFVRTKRQRPIGTIIDVVIAASADPRDRRQIKATCQVVRITPEGIGLEFQHLDPDSAALLSALLVQLKH